MLLLAYGLKNLRTRVTKYSTSAMIDFTTLDVSQIIFLPIIKTQGRCYAYGRGCRKIKNPNAVNEHSELTALQTRLLEVSARLFGQIQAQFVNILRYCYNSWYVRFCVSLYKLFDFKLIDLAPRHLLICCNWLRFCVVILTPSYDLWEFIIGSATKRQLLELLL